MSPDVIVVGGGLGGLSAAAELSLLGYRVLLVESHDKVGGFATTYKRAGYLMEGGIHMLSGNFAGALYENLFSRFQLTEHVPLVPIPNFYTMHFDSRSLTMPFGIAKAAEVLIREFPKERAGIETFFKTLVEVTLHFKEFIERKPFIPAHHPFFSVVYPKFSPYWNLSLGQFVDSLFKDPVLKAFLLANMTFYHDKPYELSLVMYLICQFNYFQGGGYFIKKGSQTLSDHLKQLIEKKGGQVMLDTTVLSIEQRDKKWHLTCQNLESNFVLEAPVLFYNGAIPNFFQKLFKPFNAERASYEDSLGLSVSAITIYLGLKESLGQFGCRDYMNLFIHSRNHDQSLNPYRDSFGVLDYGQIHSGLTTKENSHSIEIIQMADFKDWQNHSYNEKQKDKLYLNHKKELLNKTLYYLNERFNGVRDSVIYSEVSSPFTVKRYTHHPAGSIYGYLPSKESFKARSSYYEFFGGAEFKEKLYFCSAWSFIPGFGGALLSGYKAAQEFHRKQG